jgi:hypothetical protein
MWQKSRSYSSASSSSSNLPGTLLDQDPELRLQLHFSSDLARKGKLMLLVLVLVLVLVDCIHHIVSQNTASRIGGKKKKEKSSVGLLLPSPSKKNSNSWSFCCHTQHLH